MGVLRGGKARRFCLLLCFLLPGGSILFAAAHARAWYHYQEAQTNLARYHFAEARNHLAVTLRAWPNAWRVHLLAARTARLDGAFEEAQQHLQFCQQAQPKNPEVILEWALLRAGRGELAAVEVYLLEELRQGSGQTALIEEALIEGYTRTYRIGQALAGVENWLSRQPEDTQALFLQGCIWQQVQRPRMALGSYRRVVELDPERDDARWRLAQCLVKLGLSDEAEAHLQYLHHRFPDNPEMTVELAVSLFRRGQADETRRLLDGVLAENPDCVPALRERARLALVAENAVAAEKWLRQAARLNPHDPQLYQLLSSALRYQGNQDEAEKLENQLKRTDRDFQRMGEICLRELGKRPDDAALHAELGALLLRLGYADAGRNWLLLAVKEDPNSEAVRTALESLPPGSPDIQARSE